MKQKKILIKIYKKKKIEKTNFNKLKTKFRILYKSIKSKIIHNIINNKT